VLKATPVQKPRPQPDHDHAPTGVEGVDQPAHPCPCCGSPMVIIEMFEAGSTPRKRPTACHDHGLHRYVMMMTATISHVTADRLCRWLMAGSDAARPNHLLGRGKRLAAPCTNANFMPLWAGNGSVLIAAAFPVP